MEEGEGSGDKAPREGIRIKFLCALCLQDGVTIVLA